MVNLFESGKSDVIFLDETVFTVGQTSAYTWMAKGQKITTMKKRAGFSAIAAIAGKNIAGDVFAHHLADKSIQKMSSSYFCKRFKESTYEG